MCVCQFVAHFIKIIQGMVLVSNKFDNLVNPLPAYPEHYTFYLSVEKLALFWHVEVRAAWDRTTKGSAVGIIGVS